MKKSKIISVLTFTLVIVFFGLENVYAQSVTEDAKESTLEEIPDEIPLFKEGGEQGLIEYIKTNLKYPQSGIDNKEEVTVMVIFTILEDGSVDGVQAYGKTTNQEFFSSAESLIKSTEGLWNPALKDGQPISMKYRLPLSFKLN